MSLENSGGWCIVAVETADYVFDEIDQTVSYGSYSRSCVHLLRQQYESTAPATTIGPIR